MTSNNIKYLFEPRAVAVIGASSHKGKIGYKIVENIVNSGYNGKVYPVNPKGGKVLGWPIYKALEDIKGPIDVATIVIPAQFVFEAVKSCAVKQVKFLSIISSGFSEIGNSEEEKKITDFALAHGMRLLGPNIFGFYSASGSINATFGPADIRPGNVAIITQSGALGIAMIGKTAVENIGLSAIISVGNKADLDEADLLEYLLTHKATTVIMMYIEGVKAGHKLISALKKTTAKKPVVVVKSGRSKRGAVAAASHTGSLAGADDVFDDIMKQCNVLRAESIKEALEWCKFFSNTALPSGDNTLIVTNGGGIGVMATDACEKYGVKLYDNYNALKKQFSGVIPSFGSAKNPIDLTGQAESTHYKTAFDTSRKSKDIDAVISLYCETAVFDIQNFAPLIEKTYKQYKSAGKPIIFCLVGGAPVEDCVRALRQKDIPAFNDPYEAVACLGALYFYHNNLKNKSELVPLPGIDQQVMREIIDTARAQKRRFLLANEGQRIISAAGVPVPGSHIARSIEEAVQYAEQIKYPVVLKVVSRDILHKSDAGGIALDLSNKDEVVQGYEAILHNCLAYNPNAVIDGIEVTEMVQPGTELIIGARRDPSFGPVVMFGLGGIYVEVMKDIAFRALPLNRNDLDAMIKEIKSYPLLLGVRGEAKKDIDGVTATIAKVGGIIMQSTDISDIEINPLVVYEAGVKAVDVRILLADIKEKQ
jgi:acetyltransferase